MKNIFSHRWKFERKCSVEKGKKTLFYIHQYIVHEENCASLFSRAEESAQLPKFYIFLDSCLSLGQQGNDALNEYRWYWWVPGQGDNGLNFAVAGHREVSSCARRRRRRRHFLSIRSVYLPVVSRLSGTNRHTSSLSLLSSNLLSSRVKRRNRLYFTFASSAEARLRASRYTTSLPCLPP